MSPIRILYIINSENIGGAENTLINLIDGMDKNEFQINLCILGKSPLAAQAISRGLEVREIKTYNGKKDLFFFKNLFSLTRMVKPDIIHSHIWITNLYSCLCGRILGVPVISTFHSNHSIETFYERLSLKIIYLFSKRIVMVSNYQLKHYGFSCKATKINVIQNGIPIFQECPTH